MVSAADHPSRTLSPTPEDSIAGSAFARAQGSPIDAAGVAIIGMACRYPGAPSVEAFWTNLRDGVEGISFFSPEELQTSGVDPAVLEDAAYVPAGAVVDGIELFDAEFFAVGPREAEIMDPQHRLLLECTWEALESAGYDPHRYGGAIGVYAGAGRNTYLLNNLLPDPGLLALLDGFQISIGSDNDYLATRVSYKLDLVGPSVTVQCASSTSLVAVHLACRALQSGDCDMALAGGVTVKVPQSAGYRYKAGGVRSSNGHTRAFDEAANGTVFGSGIGVVVLKPLGTALADGDHIHAVIRGSAVNNDGGRKRSYTAPSREAVAEVVARALANAGVGADTVSYVEAHATGTSLGDPLEVAALSDAFRKWTQRTGFCALGSVKTNIGHPSAAAGIAGLIKAALALEHRQIPPSLNFERPNPAIDFAASPFYVNTSLRDWATVEGTPRRAGVSGLGFGGTNAHVVLEEAPLGSLVPSSRSCELLTLSARTPSALQLVADRVTRHLRNHPELDLGDVAYTLQTGRREFPCRLAVVCRSSADAAEALGSRDPRRALTAVAEPGDRPIAFVFPGHGSQYVNMTRGLYEGEPLFRRRVDACAGRLEPLLGADIRRVLYPAVEEEETAARLLEQTRFTQPALFTVEYALGGLWMDWGVRPQALIGYSIGEYAAACLAEIFSLEDALTVVAARAGLAQRIPEGAMLAVALPEDGVEPLLGSGLSLAAVSAPTHCVVAGPPDCIERLREELASRGVACKRLTLSRAFHSEMMEPVLGEYRSVLGGVRLRPPVLELVSGVTGTWLRPEEATNPEHWVRELRQTVRFSQGVSTLAADPRRIFLEVGPGNLLSALVRGHPDVTGAHAVVPSCRSAREPAPDREALLAAVGRLWVAGLPVEWNRLYSAQPRRRVPLPTYPFERQRYWIDPPASPARTRSRARESAGEEGPLKGVVPLPAVLPPPPDGLSARSRPRLPTPYVAPGTPLEQRIAAIWQGLLGVSQVGVHDRLFELGGDSLVAVQLVSRVRDALRVDVPLAAFLEAPTVSTLTALVTGGLARNASPRQVADLLREVERLPPDGSAGRTAAQATDLPRGRVAAPMLATAAAPSGDMRFSLFFFSGDESAFTDDRYRLVLEGAKFADRHGFTAVWTPERHFDKFGGLYPNPAVLGAALAAVTERIQIRAGSVVVPLHHPVRIAEEWAVVDNLSHGRVGLAFASGFHPNDFVLAPDDFPDRKQIMLQSIDTIRRLWRGDSLRMRTGHGRDIDIRVYPRPVQQEPPIWLASTQSVETFIEAGKIGANVLTALLRFGIEDLEERIARYRESLYEHGHDPRAGTVTVMLHTLVGPVAEAVRAAAARPLAEYLRSHLAFILPMADGAGAGGGRVALSDADRDALVAHAFERYSTTQALIGTPGACLQTIERLAAIGVDEVACLIDFGVDFEAAMEGLHHLSGLRTLVAGHSLQRAGS